MPPDPSSAIEEPADLRPIARLRRVVEALARLGPPDPADAAWFVAAARRYQAAQTSGVALDLGQAMGLGGARPAQLVGG